MTEIERYARAVGVAPADVPLLAVLPNHDGLIAEIRQELERRAAAAGVDSTWIAVASLEELQQRVAGS